MEQQKELEKVFVSNALRAVDGIKQEKATDEQWLAMLQKNGGLKAGEDKRLGINSFRNVFPKNYHDWIHGINQGKLLRVDDKKKKIQDIIDALRINPVDYISDNALNSAAKIIKDVENPKYLGDNLSDDLFCSFSI